MPSEPISTITRLFADRRGTVFVRYSSIILLVAIAAIAVLSRTEGHI